MNNQFNTLKTVYDVIVVGSGPAGYVCAIRSAQLGLDVALVERDKLGGVCLNEGCIPSKSLLRNAEIALLLRDGGSFFGFSFENLYLDYSIAVKRSRENAQKLADGLKHILQKNQITIIQGTGVLQGKGKVMVVDLEGCRTTLFAQHVVLATGASPVLPSLWKVSDQVLTYKEAILQETLPKSVVVIGSGAIGLEFASIWNAYGTEVTILEMESRIAPLEDEEVSKSLYTEMTKRGITILKDHSVQSIRKDNTGLQVQAESPTGSICVRAEQVLVAIGFKPNTYGIGLESVDLGTMCGKKIETDQYMSTSIPGLWAVGDVTGQLMLAHVGYAQGALCAEKMGSLSPEPIDYLAVPHAIYSIPQVASFGYSEKQARQIFGLIKVGRYPFGGNGKALGMGETSGWVKLIFGGDHDELLGAHMIGPEVSELLPELTLAKLLEATDKDISMNIHAHPTLSEIIREAALDASGKALHK